jgi:hypothetical protein
MKIPVTRVLLGITAAITGAVAPLAYAQRPAAAGAPAILMPLSGHSVFAKAHATGTQGYVCLPNSPGASTVSWTAKGSRPEATLYQRLLGHEFQVMTHFLSPNTNPDASAPNPLPFGNATWQSSLDSSKVWAQPIPSRVVAAGTDASCPNHGAVPCLLLEAIGSDQGPSGGRLLTITTYVQRLNTEGGAAPVEGCAAMTDVGNQKLVPYTADYVFFRKDR